MAPRSLTIDLTIPCRAVCYSENVVAQHGLFGFALALVVSVAGCTFGSAVGSGASESGGMGASSTGGSESGAGDAPAPATSSGDQGGGQDEDTTVGISGTAGSTSVAHEDTTASDGTSSSGDTGGSTTDAVASCDDLFMSAPGYIYCDESRTTCSFNANTDGTCNAMCASLGSECVAAFDNPNSAGEECIVIRPNTDTCETERGTEICECTRP